MITFKPNRFQSVNKEEEEEVECGWCLSEWGWWEGIGGGLSVYILVLFLSLFMVLYLMCFFDFDFSGDYVIELFGKWIATHRLSKCKSPHHDHRGICFLPWIMVVFSGLTIFSGMAFKSKSSPKRKPIVEKKLPKRKWVIWRPYSVEHILYVMSAMNPSYGLNYCKCYWNHGLQRVARIEAVGVCFNGCEWECVWMRGMLIIWNGNKRWMLMEWRG